MIARSGNFSAELCLQKNNGTSSRTQSPEDGFADVFCCQCRRRNNDERRSFRDGKQASRRIFEKTEVEGAKRTYEPILARTITGAAYGAYAFCGFALHALSRFIQGSGKEWATLALLISETFGCFGHGRMKPMAEPLADKIAAPLRDFFSGSGWHSGDPGA